MVQELSEFPNSSNNDSQTAPRKLHSSIHKRELEYQNDDANHRTSGVQPQSPKYELPQSPIYENPEQLPNHQYEYPDVRVVNGGCSPPVRPSLSKRESKNSSYTSLNNGQETSEEASVTEREDEGDGLYDDVMYMNGDYTPLARRPSKDSENEVPPYEPLLYNGQEKIK